MAAPETNARVIQKIDVASGLMILRVAPEGWNAPPFRAGQYTVLGLPGSAPRARFSDPEDPLPPPEKRISRAYSAASSSREGEYLEFYITLVRSGALTPRLFALEPGDPVWVSPKMVGMFTLDQVPRDQNVVFLATGTGLAPYMSMLRTHISDFSAKNVSVVHAARHSWDLGYRAELETIARLCPWFTYFPILSSPAEERFPWTGLTGFIHEHWKAGTFFKSWKEEPAPATTRIFLCGNPLMIEAMMGILRESGFRDHSPKEPGQIHLEKYW
jgi:ferredoxin/flavodoxin---NADP+ reductase